jgi:redox-sensitive bicupin YhaK (pirin superfamily)
VRRISVITIRKAEDRGGADYGWLQANHTFSFARYYNPEHMNFRCLRVMNEDHISPGKGFDTHPHDNMEIITYVLEGALEHKDSMGTGSVIKAGDLQRMSAGSGVTHSEFNHSLDTPVHLYQIWITPSKRDVPPSYDQKSISPEETQDTFLLVAGPHASDLAMQINQDAYIYLASVTAGTKIHVPLERMRFGWLQVLRGTTQLESESLPSETNTLSAGDGAAIEAEGALSVSAVSECSLLLFDLP